MICNGPVYAQQQVYSSGFVQQPVVPVSYNLREGKEEMNVVCNVWPGGSYSGIDLLKAECTLQVVAPCKGIWSEA